MPSEEELGEALAASRAADATAAADVAQRRAEAAERRAAELERDRDMYRERLSTEEQRLEKLWDAYKAQEGDLRQALERTGRLERELKGKDVTVSESERLLHEREDDVRRLHEELDTERKRAAALELAKSELEDADRIRQRLEEVEALYAGEKERLAKLYIVYEELEGERDDLARRLEEKEAWFRKYEKAFQELTGKKP
ncbi:MAG TPA: hypothetical protein VI997_08925 [Candidatus Thermoplasmatota archaeon]|nr:hypothetical protein [Candidatus Thermoplasmatota archaeon]